MRWLPSQVGNRIFISMLLWYYSKCLCYETKKRVVGNIQNWQFLERFRMAKEGPKTESENKARRKKWKNEDGGGPGDWSCPAVLVSFSLASTDYFLNDSSLLIFFWRGLRSPLVDPHHRPSCSSQTRQLGTKFSSSFFFSLHRIFMDDSREVLKEEHRLFQTTHSCTLIILWPHEK